MSVIVKGMGMPYNCHVCGLCYDGWCYTMPAEIDEMCPNKDRPVWCPLRPLPEKHGRLIDESWLKDTMITTLEALKINPKMDGQEMHLIAAFDTLRVMIDDAPTIVEAEGD